MCIIECEEENLHIQIITFSLKENLLPSAIIFFGHVDNPIYDNDLPAGRTVEHAPAF